MFLLSQSIAVWEMNIAFDPIEAILHMNRIAWVDCKGSSCPPQHPTCLKTLMSAGQVHIQLRNWEYIVITVTSGGVCILNDYS